MKIIVGLGNPGDEYKDTRHNVGFISIDSLKDRLAFTDDFKLKKKFNALICEGKRNDETILLVKPQTYMNLSGTSVRSLIDYYKADLSDLWVIHDDLDFEVGVFKIRKKGSGGTHNGVISLIENLKSEDFVRFRVGIESRKGEKKMQFKGKDFVLSKFGKEITEINKTLYTVTEAIVFGLDNGINEAMNKFN